MRHCISCGNDFLPDDPNDPNKTHCDTCMGDMARMLGNIGDMLAEWVHPTPQGE